MRTSLVEAAVLTEAAAPLPLAGPRGVASSSPPPSSVSSGNASFAISLTSSRTESKKSPFPSLRRSAKIGWSEPTGIQEANSRNLAAEGGGSTRVPGESSPPTLTTT